MLLRVAKRRTSLEAPFDQFLRIEFRQRDGRPDLDLSVYEIEPQQVVRAHTEHYAACGLGPRGGHNFDVTGLSAREACVHEGNELFQFTRAAHRELRFADEAELHGFALQLYRERDHRRVSVSKLDMREYVRGHVKTGDTEWIQFIRARPRDQTWAKWASA